MHQVSEHVDSSFLQQSAPRTLSPDTLVGLMSDRLFERPASTLLHPLFILGIALVVILIALQMPLWVVALPMAWVIGMSFIGAVRTFNRAWDDVCLLREGLILRAHILKLRPNRTLTGEIDGAVLDLAISVAPRRTYVGSIWISDGNEALRLLRQGRLQVLCLPRVPGTWRVIEPIRSEVSYEHVGPRVEIPEDF